MTTAPVIPTEGRNLLPSCPLVRLSACPLVRLSARPPVRLSACPLVRLSAGRNLHYFLIPENQAIFVITSADGKQIKTIAVQPGQNQVLVPITGLKAGQYLCTLKQHGKPLQSEKFIVIP